MDKKRNLLLVMTDHQRYDTIFMRQCGREVTPNLNRLAEQGTLYERAYTACPLCVPARTALATGIYPTQTGVVYNDWEDRTAVSAETMHDLLKQAAYRVGHVGVDHIRVNPPMRERGYDYFSSQAKYEDYAKKQGYILKEPEDIRYVMEACDGKLCSEGYSGTRTSIWNHPLEEFKDYFFLKQAEEFLASQEDDRPFALFVYLWAPHPPLRVPEPFASMYPPSRISLPDNIGIPAENEPASRRRGAAAQLAEGVSDEEWRQVWASYLGLVSLADDIVGKLLSSLEISGKSEDTVVVFTADHGDNLGQHSMYQKMEMYESCIRIPLIIREPGQEHERVGKLVSHLDLMPTVCSLAGIDGSRYEGISLLGRGGRERIPSDRAIFSQYSGTYGYGFIRRAMVTERDKYVFDEDGGIECYNLEKDGEEMYNLGNDPAYAERIRDMHEICKRFHKQHGDYFCWEEAEKKGENPSGG